MTFKNAKTDSLDSFEVNTNPQIMGILNITQDSFYDGGKYFNRNDALSHVKQMVSNGADIIDIGAESSRPGSLPVNETTESERIVNILEALNGKINVPLSIDTSKSSVAKKALTYNVKIINDIYALRKDPEMAGVIADNGCHVVLMHMLGNPHNMQDSPRYDNVIDEIMSFFEERIQYSLNNGIKEKNIILDPGIGFGKNLSHNLDIIKNIKAFKKMGFPLLLGPSRKSFIGEVLNLSPKDRIFGTAAVISFLSMSGVDILRVHDVDEMKQVVRMTKSIVSDLEVA